MTTQPTTPQAQVTEEMVEREIAIALLAICDVDKEYPDASENWARTLMAYGERSVHCGDCTNHPWTCNVCLILEYKLQARAILPLLRKIFSAPPARQDVEALVEALEPFAKAIAEVRRDTHPPEFTVNFGIMNGNVTQTTVYWKLKIGDFYRAAQALARVRGEKEEG